VYGEKDLSDEPSRRGKLDYFPFFTKDCESDEAIRLMDDTEFGFWMRLICCQWPNGGVPSDLDILRRCLNGAAPGGVPRTTEYIAEMLKGPVGRRMKPHPEIPGLLADPRLLKERAIAESLSNRQRRNRTGAPLVAESGRDQSTESGATKTMQVVEPETQKWSHIASVSVSVSNTNSSVEWNAEEAFEQLWGEYPSKGRVQRPLSQQYFLDHIRSAETFATVMEALKGKWARSEKWAKGFVLALPRWIDQQCWLEEPEAAEGQAESAPPRYFQPEDWQK
jgi:hypothetical protein